MSEVDGALEYTGAADYTQYMCIKPIAVYGGKADEIQWIFKKKKDKFSDYITSVEEYNKSMGGNGSVKSTIKK